MKKFTLILLACLFPICSFGQLKVDTDGNIYVGDTVCYTYSFDTGGAIIGGSGGLRKIPEIINIKGAVSAANSSGYLFRGTPLYTGRFTLKPCFYVNWEGEVYSSVGYVQSSDVTKKENVRTLSSSLGKIKSLRGVSYNYITPQNANAASAPLKDSPMPTQNQKQRIGLIAQEVENIFPEVVRMLPDSTKGIMYNDLVAVLIEGIKELSTQVETLQQQITELQNKQSPKEDNSKESSPMKQKAKLYQNTPNPFNQETEIAYRIPSNVDAVICIYNLSGQQLKKYPLNDTNGKVTVSASEFPAGIYIYSLIINNQEIDSKRMILTD